MSIEDEKSRLRRILKHDRISLAESYRYIAQTRICRHIEQFCKQRTLAHQSSSRMIALYAATRGEADVSALFHSLRAMGWQVVLPQVVSKTEMVMRVVADWSTLVPDTFGILAPAPSAPAVHPSQVDVALVPGLGFTRSGGRLGYGGGYYDRWLAQASEGITTIGVGFDVQVRDVLPVAAHDVPLCYVVTEQGVIHCAR